MSDKTIGLYEKFKVERTDGSSVEGGKHEGCEYFVLDLTHDPLAMPALETYAYHAEKAGYALLAADLRAKVTLRSGAAPATPIVRKIECSHCHHMTIVPPERYANE